MRAGWLGAALLLACMGGGASAQQPCRQALALGLDVSGSVDRREYRLQLDGLAAALHNKEVQAALFAFDGAPCGWRCLNGAARATIAFWPPGR